MGAADNLRANSKLKSSEYSIPVLGLIFLRYADYKFSLAEQDLSGKKTGRRSIGKTDYQARGVLYLPEAGRWSGLMRLPEGANIGKAINDAMDAIKEWCKNTFEVVTQLRINTNNSHQRYDVILLINGVPVVQIELKTLAISPRTCSIFSDPPIRSGEPSMRSSRCFIARYLLVNSRFSATR